MVSHEGLEIPGDLDLERDCLRAKMFSDVRSVSGHPLILLILDILYSVTFDLSQWMLNVLGLVFTVI